VVPLLRAEGCEDQAQIGLVLPEDVRPSEAEPVILLIPLQHALPVRPEPSMCANRNMHEDHAGPVHEPAASQVSAGPVGAGSVSGAAVCPARFTTSVIS